MSEDRPDLSAVWVQIGEACVKAAKEMVAVFDVFTAALSEEAALLFEREEELAGVADFDLLRLFDPLTR
jgi:hypothetical protein